MNIFLLEFNLIFQTKALERMLHFVQSDRLTEDPFSQNKFCGSPSTPQTRDNSLYVPCFAIDKRLMINTKRWRKKSKTSHKERERDRETNKRSSNDRCRLKSTSVSDYIRFYWMRCRFILRALCMCHVIRCVCDSGSGHMENTYIEAACKTTFQINNKHECFVYILL